MSDTHHRAPSPALVAVAGWVLPGLGYWLIGHRARAITVCITILSLFTLGLLVAGIRSIDVPGYGDDGKPVLIAVRADPAGVATELRSPAVRWVATDPSAKSALTLHPVAEVLDKPWYIGQILAGPITLLCSKYSIDFSKPLPNNPEQSLASKSHVRIAEIGTLFSAVAGMLNLLVLIDAAHRASRLNTTTKVTP